MRLGCGLEECRPQVPYPSIGDGGSLLTEVRSTQLELEVLVFSLQCVSGFGATPSHKVRFANSIRASPANIMVANTSPSSLSLREGIHQVICHRLQRAGVFAIQSSDIDFILPPSGTIEDTPAECSWNELVARPYDVSPNHLRQILDLHPWNPRLKTCTRTCDTTRIYIRSITLKVHELKRIIAILDFILLTISSILPV